MKPAEAEKLLGGYATGTLTEDERQRLFTAALDHQEIFDALMDEEALRDLLADPVVKAQLILALAHSAVPNVVPFWRRSGLLGAAASLLVAASAGLLYLRSPDKTPPPLREETVKAPLAKPAAAPATQGPLRKAAPAEKAKEGPEPVPSLEVAAPPPPVPVHPPTAVQAPAAMALAPGVVATAKAKEERQDAATQDHLAKKAVATRSTAAAAVEVIANHQEGAAERTSVAQDRAAGGATRSFFGGLTGGQVGGVVAPPWWQVATGPDGTLQVTVRAPREALLLLLKRGAAGVTVLKFRPDESATGDTIPWHCSLRLAPGEVLDLYRLNKPVLDPSQLPEAGPVDGLRVRIPRPTKKDQAQ